MKKFNQFGTLLTRGEAKKIRGGAGTENVTCVAVEGAIFGILHCTNSAEDAQRIAGEGGFWCCNCIDTIGC